VIELPASDTNGVSALDVALAKEEAERSGFWRSALRSGRDCLRDAWRWTMTDGRTATIDSSSGGHYTVTPDRCTCPAGVDGRICYHRGGLVVWLRYSANQGLDVSEEQARISAAVADARARYNAVFEAAVLPDLRSVC
jgi:hypothetical protein